MKNDSHLDPDSQTSGAPIRSVTGLADHLGLGPREVTPRDIGRTIYKNTTCGAHTTFLFPGGVSLYYNDELPPGLSFAACIGVKLGSIVEGSDAEIDADPLLFPFPGADFDLTISWIEGEVDAAAESDE